MSLWSVGARTRNSPLRPVACAHCGLPAPSPVLSSTQGADKSAPGPLVFCCRTCRQIYDLVQVLAGTHPGSFLATPPEAGRERGTKP